MEVEGELYLKAAQQLKLPIILHPEFDGFEIKLGQHRYFFRSAITPFNNTSSCSVTSNKYCMNKLLEKAGFPVPKAVAYSKIEFETYDLEDLIKPLNFPLVIKPTRGTALGEDVLCNIKSLSDLKNHLEEYYQRHPLLSIEEFHGGLNSYRVLVYYHRVIAIVQRFPAAVTGDGIHSIRELIHLTNSQREQDSLIKVDDKEISIRLKELDLSLDTIINNQERIVLLYTCNCTRGGTTLSLANKIHPRNAELLISASRVLNMKLIGFDIQCKDILMPIRKSSGVIIEANSNPAVSLHEKPMLGIPHSVTIRILCRLIYQNPLQYIKTLYHNKATGLYLKAALIFIISLISLAFFPE